MIPKAVETRRKNGWFKNPKEFSRKQSERNKGSGNPMYGKKRIFSLEWRLQHSKQMSGRKRPDQSERMRGKKNPGWKGGIFESSYPTEFNDNLRIEIMKRDNYECKLCFSKKNLCIHHIDYNKKNCSKENLITLCIGCNSLVNYHRENWQFFFIAILAKVIIYPPEFTKRASEVSDLRAKRKLSTLVLL